MRKGWAGPAARQRVRAGKEPCGMDPRLTRNFPASEDETMTKKTLPDVCHDQLQDLHGACAQSPDTAAKPGRAVGIRQPIKAPIAGAQGIGDGRTPANRFAQRKTSARRLNTATCRSPPKAGS